MSFFPANWLNFFRKGGKAYSIRVATFLLNDGNTFVLYIFSMINGTVNIKVGRTLLRAGSKTAGVGGFFM